MNAGSRESTAIQRLIGRTRFRIRTQWALEGATTATVLAAATALVAVFAIRAELVGKTTGIYLLIAAGAIIVAGAVLGALRPLDDEAVARRIDRASNLSDRLSTAIAFRRTLATAGAAPTADDEHTDLMLAAIRDGERAIPRANVRAAAPFVAPRDWRAALGFLAVSALAAGLAIPTIDRTPHLHAIQPPKARPGEVVTLIGDNLLSGIATPLAALPAADVLGAPNVPAAALAPKPPPATGRGVYLGPSENPFELERQIHAIAAGFAGTPALAPLADAIAQGDVDRVTRTALTLEQALTAEHHRRLEAFTQLATRMANNRAVEVLEWTAARIRVRVPADAAYGETTLTAYVGRHTAGPLAFEVLDPKDQANFETGAVLLDPDERAYVERILAELRMVARRDDIPELEEFANKIEQLLKDAEEGKVSKEKLLEALRKAEEALNQGQEPNQAEIDKQLGELGKELQKSEVTKELGQALQQQDLERAKQELEELARKLDPKEKEKELAELQKKLEELQKQELTEQQKQELAKQMDELKKQLEDKDGKLTEQQKQELQKKLEELQKKLEQQRMTEQQKQQLQKQMEQLKKEQPLTEQQKQELQKQLEKTAKQMQQQQQAQQQKMEQQKQKLEDEIRRLQKQRDEAKTEQERLDAERRLEKKKDELKQLQKQEDQRQQSAQRDAIKRLQKDIEQAAEQLQKPKSKEESEQEQEARERQASQKLKDAARETGRVDHDKRKQATQKKIATQMDDLREAMQRAKQKGNKGPQDPFGRKGKNQDFAQRARGQKGSGQAWRPGQGQGQGGGQPGGQQGGGQGGKQWGTGTGPDLAGDPTTKSGNTKDQDLEGALGSKGGSRRETILAAAQKGFASKAYKDVYQKYEEIVEEVMRNEKLPSSYKYYVKRYFAKIHPEAGLDVEITKTPGK
ncbi:MAG TPA: hypothetical protein VK932_21385 [Kofleriaceae bacterium]|nr:hypothetical protein [Kofleriaceae bacterium]